MLKSWSFITKGFFVLLLFLFFYFGNTRFLFAQESATIVATVSISICGNSIVEGGEVCDMKNLNNLSIEDFGYEYGELKCSISCDEYDLSDCSNAPKEIELETEVISEKVLEDDVKKEEETSKEGEIVNPEMNNNEMPVLTNDNVLSHDLVPEENNMFEIQSSVFEEVLLTQDFTSRAPP